MVYLSFPLRFISLFRFAHSFMKLRFLYNERTNNSDFFLFTVEKRKQSLLPRLHAPCLLQSLRFAPFLPESSSISANTAVGAPSVVTRIHFTPFRFAPFRSIHRFTSSVTSTAFCPDSKQKIF